MINWNRVRELHNDVGADEFVEIVDVFLSEVEEIVAALHNVTNDQDMELNLHALKNAALNLGFSDLSELCQTAENLARSGQASSVDLREIFQRLSASLRLFESEASRQLSS